jgi:peroxiredoxin
VQIQKKYESLGVVFLGVTARTREQATAFTTEMGITWPNAYGVGSLTMSAPVIFVIGADGRVAWSDHQSRYHHDLDDFRADIEAAIDRALRPTVAARPPMDKVTESRGALPPHGG